MKMSKDNITKQNKIFSSCKIESAFFKNCLEKYNSNILIDTEAATGGVLYKKSYSENVRKHLCWILFLINFDNF